MQERRERYEEKLKFPINLLFQITHSRQRHASLLLRRLLNLIPLLPPVTLTSRLALCARNRRRRREVAPINTGSRSQRRLAPLLRVRNRRGEDERQANARHRRGDDRRAGRAGTGITMGGRRRARVREGHGVVVRDRLQLQRVLLGMMCGQDLVEDDEGAVPVPR